MNFPKINAAESLTHLAKYLDEHKPAALAGLGIFFSCAATIQASKSGVKAKERLDDAMREHAKENPDKEFTRWDRFKATAPCYIAPVLLEASSAFCMISSTKESRKRELVAWGCYEAAKETYNNYRGAAEEYLTKSKAEAIASRADEKLVESKDFKPDDIPEGSSYGELCIDALSGQVFRTTHDRLKRVEAELNQLLMMENYMPMNFVYGELGLEENEMGELIGCNVRDYPIQFDISTQMKDGHPCMVLRIPKLSTKYAEL